ncbi:MAG: STAS domain-containing protein [Clostridiales bacterium]|nr:STAS domain-containing protein [Clostridiales bacterium]
MLDIKKTVNGNELVIVMTGRLDTLTAPQLEEELSASIDSAENLVFDFSELEYISSAGLRVLLSAQKTKNASGSMTVKNVSEEIREIFDVTGFSDILTIE